MDTEISTAAKIGISLILIGAIIAAMFATLLVMRNMVWEQQQDIRVESQQNKLRYLADFNDTIVSGAQVKQAAALYAGKGDFAFQVTTAGHLIKEYGASSLTHVLDGDYYYINSNSVINSVDTMDDKTNQAYYVYNHDTYTAHIFYNRNHEPIGLGFEVCT